MPKIQLAGLSLFKIISSNILIFHCSSNMRNFNITFLKIPIPVSLKICIILLDCAIVFYFQSLHHFIHQVGPFSTLLVQDYFIKYFYCSLNMRNFNTYHFLEKFFQSFIKSALSY